MSCSADDDDDDAIRPIVKNFVRILCTNAIA
jgi:hypothetical protein